MAGEVIRALAALGPNEAAAVIARAREKLAPNDIKELLSVRSQVPTWAAAAISTLVTHA